MSALAPPVRREHLVENRVVLFFVAVSFCVIALYRLWPASPLWMPVALVAIALAIWHGAYDTVLAKALWQPSLGARWLLPFVAAYVGLAAVVVVAWWKLPLAALAAFLLYSGLHFGTEAEVERRPLPILGAAAFGCLPIAAACHWQARSVTGIFAAMLRGEAEAAKSVTALAGSLLLPCILLSLVSVVSNRHELLRRIVLIGSQLVLFRFCPPVLAFAVFFCTLHTPEHLVETCRTASRRFSVKCMGQNLRQGIGPWLLSLAAVATAAYVGRHTVQAYTGMLFITLSALTVPHMILGMLSSSALRRKSQQVSPSAQRFAHP